MFGWKKISLCVSKQRGLHTRLSCNPRCFCDIHLNESMYINAQRPRLIRLDPNLIRII